MSTEQPKLATKAGLAELRGDMRKMNAAILRWMLGTVIVVIGTVVLGFAGLMIQVASSKVMP